MTEKSTVSSRTLSSSALGLVWFGAAVSLAEILTGTFFAPLGFTQGVFAILLGHIIGCSLFWLVAAIGARTGKSAMETVQISFGKLGSVIFSVANVLQLVGWTAIMVASAAASAVFLVPLVGMVGWCLVIGALIVVWIAIGMKNMSRVQSAASIGLFVLTAIISVVVFGGGTVTSAVDPGAISFGAAVELAVAMPLSWLPVASDYTREAKHPFWGTTAATAAYFFGSSWMFVIGLGLALFAGTDDLAAVMASAGLGVAGVVVVVFSTVTTTFLDAESAGVSASSIHSKLDARTCGIVFAIVGTVLAATAPVGDFEGFLYLIGSVFAPMAAILCVDCYILHNDASNQQVNWVNIGLWVAGFILYRFSMGWDLPVGNTFPVMLITAAATVLVHCAVRRFGSGSDHHPAVSRAE
jgi:putative hydroxymethylpyrimidine transporter CytX